MTCPSQNPKQKQVRRRTGTLLQTSQALCMDLSITVFSKIGGRTFLGSQPLQDPKNGASQQAPSFPNIVLSSLLGGLHLLDALRGLGKCALHEL